MMTYKRLSWAITLAASQMGALASAAPTPLSTFVDSTAGATQTQKNAGVAVQNMCSYLGTQGFTPTNALSGTDKAEGDLFLRCNELVQTARALLGQTGATSRSLGVGAAGLLGAVQQVSGEEVAAQGTLASQVPSGQFSNITSRINALRYGYAGVSMRGRVTALSSSSNDSDAMTDTFHDSRPMAQLAQWSRAYADDDSDEAQVRLRRAAYLYSGDSADSTALPAVLSSNPWGLFTEGTYNFGHRDQSPDDDAFHYHSESVTAGLDYNFGRGVVGVSAGYDYYKADFIANGVTVSGGDTRVEGTTGSLFGAWFGDDWNVNGIASYGSLNSEITRVVSYSPTATSCTGGVPSCGATRTLRGTPDGKDFAVGVNAGYDLHAGALMLTPSWAVNYRHIKIDSYSETDLTAPAGGSGLPLAYDDQAIDSLRSVLGFDAVLPISRAFGVLSPSFHAEWDHEFRNAVRDVSVRYSVDPTFSGNSATCVSCFVIPTERPDADFGVVGVGLTALFSNRLQASLSYERLVGVSYLTSNAITLQVRGQL